MNFPVLDLHCDTALSLLREEGGVRRSLRRNTGHIDLARGSKIGGYAWNTQDDPRCRDGLDRYDTLLLQIDSVYSGDCQISFGDSGVALFLIPSDKLKACDFSDILFWWDCY